MEKNLTTYLETLTPMQRGRAKKQLEKVYRYCDGSVMTEAEKVVEMLKGSNRLYIAFDKKLVYGIYIDEEWHTPITSFAAKYAQYLGAKFDKERVGYATILKRMSDIEKEYVKLEKEFNGSLYRYSYLKPNDIFVYHSCDREYFENTIKSKIRGDSSKRHWHDKELRQADCLKQWLELKGDLIICNYSKYAE